MITFALRSWDGFHIIGEGLGLTGTTADRFADVAWVVTTTLLAICVITMAVAVSL